MKKLYLAIALLAMAGGCNKDAHSLADGDSAILNIGGTSYSIAPSGGKIDIPIETNTDYIVSIPTENRSWISATSARTVLSLIIKENFDVISRSSSISLLDRADNVLAEIFISQNGNIPRNQIFYTSSDGGKVLPDTRQNLFGPGFTITSNTYFGGQGIITFDGDITTVGDKAFSGCSNLRSIILPEGVTSIGSMAFEDCTSLTDITIPTNTSSVGAQAFSNCTALSRIALPDKITEIGYGVFQSCSALTDVYLPYGLSAIGAAAFVGCSSLTGISIPGSVTIIGNDSFCDCSSLNGIIIPDSVTEIGNYSFKNCVSLDVLSIPPSVKKLGQGIASGCVCDLYIYPPDSDCSYNAPMSGFAGYVIVPDDAASIPEGFRADSKTTKGYKGKFASSDNHCLIYEGTLIDYVRGDGASSYQTPEGIRKIGRYAFGGAYMYLTLTNLRLSEGVEEIAENGFGFHFNDLKVIELPSTLKKIGTNAFVDCQHIQYICCQALIPPDMAGTAGLQTNYMQTVETIYVPKESEELYKNAEGWSLFASEIYGVTWPDTDFSPLFSDDMWPY